MTLIKQLWKIFRMTRRVGGLRGAVQMARTGPKQVALFRRLMADARVPALAKAIVIGAAIFAVSPLNVPQYVPVLGALDDLGIALLAINFFLKQVPLPVLSEHRRAVGLPDNLETL